MTVKARVMKYDKPDCIFCGNWRSTMIQMTDDMGGSLNNFICILCANEIVKVVNDLKKKEN